MRTRAEIKTLGRTQFKNAYWPDIGAMVLAMLPIFVISFLYTLLAETADSTGVLMLCFLLEIACILIQGPLIIGMNHYYIKRSYGQENVAAAGVYNDAFTGYGRKLGGYLLMGLFTALWSLLFFIPGIIKSYAYALTPYILADCPNVRANDARKLSIRIMKGKKGKLFGFHLSYIGWAILTSLTCGILGIFYVYPWMNNAMAIWYLEAREDALRQGVITLGQLEGTEAV